MHSLFIADEWGRTGGGRTHQTRRQSFEYMSVALRPGLSGAVSEWLVFRTDYAIGLHFAFDNVHRITDGPEKESTDGTRETEPKTPNRVAGSV